MNDPARRPDADLATLFALARTRRPDTSAAEYAFETRLLARLGAQRHVRDETSSIWAMVSWRLAPFFAACVLALALWQSQLTTDTNEAADIASLENPETVDLWSNLN
jgi:hypothetical protein